MVVVKADTDDINQNCNEWFTHDTRSDLFEQKNEFCDADIDQADVSEQDPNRISS